MTETENSARPFDCVKFTREARQEIYEETKHMSLDELGEYWRKFRETDPVWQRWVSEQRALGRPVPD